MADGNGHDEDKKVKDCPLLDKECIGDKCVLYSELARAGISQKFGMCAFNAVVLILSEINQKTQVTQQQKIQLPSRLLRG